MTIDQTEQALILNKLKLARIIWFANIIADIALYLIISNIAFTAIKQDFPYIHYVLGALAISELIVIVVMRRIRMKPSVVKKLSAKSPGEVARNFFNIDIISLCLADTVFIYGIVGYILTGDFQILKMFAAVTALALIYFFPRESARTAQYEDSFTAS